MRSSRIIPIVSLLLLGFALLLVAPANAQEAKVEIPKQACFQSSLADGTTGVTLKIATQRIGKDRFILSGSSYNPETGALISLGNGSGEIVDGKLNGAVTLVGTGEGYVFYDVYYAVFEDATKLKNATFNGVENLIFQDNASKSTYLEGTLKRVACK